MIFWSDFMIFRFDEKAAFVFVGTYAGEILIVHLHDPSGASSPGASALSSSSSSSKAAPGTVELIRVLKGHNGSVRSLAWEPARSVLYSGSFDAGINEWDIGGGKGQVYELNGHSCASVLCYVMLYSMIYAVSNTPSVRARDLSITIRAARLL